MMSAYSAPASLLVFSHYFHFHFLLLYVRTRTVWIDRVRPPILQPVVSCTGHRTQDRGKMAFFPVSPHLRLRIWTPREIGSAIPSRVSLLILHNQAKSGTYSRDCFRFQRRGVHTVRHAVRHRVSLEFVGSHDYVAMTFTAENPPAQGH